MTDRLARDTVGDLIDGRYKLDRLIGEGGMGHVYEAEHVGIGKQVALKILHPVLSNTADVVARFRREARIATAIGNPHIVDVTDSGTTEDGRFYFVMEYLDGIELAEVMHSGNLDLPRALHIAGQIAEALGAAHQQGIIHRDLKPENILLVERGSDRDFVKVLDFGIARTVDSDRSQKRLTQPGIAMGTPEYMAPEQALARPTDARSDVYSLGAILYEMATGKQPYRGESYTEILVAKASTEPTPPRELRGDLPEPIEALILKAMAREPDGRYSSMEELATEIDRCMQQLGESAAGYDFDDQSTAVGSMPMIAEEALPLIAPTPPVPAPPVPTPAPPMASASPSPSAQPMPSAPPMPNATTTPVAIQASPNWQRRAVGLFLVLVIVAGGAYWYQHLREPEATAVPPTEAELAAAETSKTTEARTADRPRRKRVEPKRKQAKAEPAAKPAEPAKEPPPRSAKHARALLAKAHRARDRKQWAAARSLYDRVARGRPLDEWGHIGLAQVALQNDNPDNAIDHATTALKAGGGVPARMVLAAALRQSGRHGAAIEQYRKVLKAQPRNREARRQLKQTQAAARRANK